MNRDRATSPRHDSMHEKKLSSKVVEYQTAPGPKRLDVWDTVLQGFGIRVSPSGRKVWFVVVRPGGHPKRVSIGTYPAISLADAREAAGKIIREVQLGVFEPAPRAAIPTLGETIPLFIQMYAKPKNRGWKAHERVLHKFEALFNRPLNEIKRNEVARALDVLIGSGMTGGANRALAAIKKLMSWALDRGMIEVNPIAGLKPPAKEQSRDRVLSDTELAALMRAAEVEGYPFGNLFKLLAFTAQRRGEVSDMRWSEIDFGRNIWTIPAARSKNGQAHDVPLASEVIAIIRSAPRFLGSDYVFSTTGKSPISGFGRVKDRLNHAVGATDWRTHDLRRTAASGMARLGIAPHVVEKVLNHRSGIISGVAAVYNRYGYDKEKRDALVAWADHLTKLLSSPSPTSGERSGTITPIILRRTSASLLT